MLILVGRGNCLQTSHDGVTWTNIDVPGVQADVEFRIGSVVGERLMLHGICATGYCGGTSNAPGSQVWSTPLDPINPTLYLDATQVRYPFCEYDGDYYYCHEPGEYLPGYVVRRSADLDGAWTDIKTFSGDEYDVTGLLVPTPAHLLRHYGTRRFYATNGVDYTTISTALPIPAGETYEPRLDTVERDAATGTLVALGFRGAGGKVYLYYSTDNGLTWSLQGEVFTAPSTSTDYYRHYGKHRPCMCIEGGQVVIAGWDGSVYYIAVADLGTGIIGEAVIDASRNLLAASYDTDNEQWVVAGDNGCIYTSSNLTAWTARSAADGYTGDFVTVVNYATGMGGALNPPTNVQASDGTYTNRVMVTWDANDAATAYEVWRATNDDNALAEKQGADVVDAFYSDPYVEAGVTYYYWIKSKNATEITDFSDGDSGYVRSSVDLDASSENAERQGLIAQYNFADWKFLTKSTGDIMVDPVQEGVDYFCKLRSVSIFGKKQPFDAAYTVHRRIIGRLETYPPDLTGLTAVPNGDTVTIFADALTDPDIDGYEIRLGQSWEGGIFISYNKAPNTRLVGVRPGVHTFWMAARNNAGNYSLNPVNASCRVFIPPGYSPFGIDPAETFDYDSGSFNNTQRIITPPGSTSNPLLMVTHTGDMLTGTWVSDEHDLGSTIQCRVWGDFSTQFATSSMYWDNIIPAPTAWRDVGADIRTWAEIIGLSNIQRAGRLRATLYHRMMSTDPWYEVDYFEILCAEVEARFLRVGVELTDPGLEAHLYLKALNLSVYIW